MAERLAVDQDPPFVQWNQVVQATEERGLSRPTRTHNDYDFPLLDGQINSPQDVVGAEPLVRLLNNNRRVTRLDRRVHASRIS